MLSLPQNNFSKYSLHSSSSSGIIKGLEPPKLLLRTAQLSGNGSTSILTPLPASLPNVGVVRTSTVGPLASLEKSLQQPIVRQSSIGNHNFSAPLRKSPGIIQTSNNSPQVTSITYTSRDIGQKRFVSPIPYEANGDGGRPNVIWQPAQTARAVLTTTASPRVTPLQSPQVEDTTNIVAPTVSALSHTESIRSNTPIFTPIATPERWTPQPTPPETPPVPVPKNPLQPSQLRGIMTDSFFSLGSQMKPIRIPQETQPSIEPATRAIWLAEQVTAYCKRTRTTPRDLFLSYQPRQGNCLLRPDLETNLMKTIPGAKKIDASSLADECTAMCVEHKVEDVEALAFEEAVMRGHSSGLSGTVGAADMGLKFFSGVLTHGTDNIKVPLVGQMLGGGNFHSNDHSSKNKDREQPTPLSSDRTRTPRNGTTPRQGLSAFQRIANAGSSGTCDRSTFIAFGGDQNTGVMKKEDFARRLKSICLQAGWSIPNDLIKERWAVVDPQDTGRVSYSEFHKAFLVGHRVKKINRSLGAGKVGLDNLGNTCFMNSALQCIRACRDLVDQVTDPDFLKKNVNRENFMGSKGEIALVLSNLFATMDGSTRSSEAPSDFLRVIPKFGPKYAGSRQHDAQEFIGFILDYLHEDFNRVKKKPYIEQKDITDQTLQEKGFERLAAEEWYHYLLRDKSVVVDTFQGQTCSRISCERCKYSLTKFEPFMFLSLPTISAEGRALTSLDQCLQEFCRPEKLSGDNQWYCQKCKARVDAVKSMHLWKLPKYLIVPLKRFQFTQSGRGGMNQTMSKVTHNVDIPMHFGAQRHIPKESPQRQPPIYDLISFVKHFGSPSFGHYTGYARHPDGSWQCYDDSYVTSIPEEEIRTKSTDAYVYFFERSQMSQELNHVLTSNCAPGPSVGRQTTSQPQLWPHLASHGRQWSFLEE